MCGYRSLRFGPDDSIHVVKAIGDYPMACNLTKNRRLKRWWNFERENSPSISEWGYALGGAMAREFWLEFDTVQTDPNWLFLNAGMVLHYDGPTTQSVPTGEWVWLSVSQLALISFALVGTSEQREINGVPFTVNQQLSITRLNGISGPIISLEVGNAIRQAPSVISPAVWGEFAQLLPDPGEPSTIDGGAVAYPLIPCHDCTG